MLRLTTGALALLATCGCSLLLPEVDPDVRCLDLPAATCDEAWTLVEGELPTDGGLGEIVDAVVGRTGGAAEGCGDDCPGDGMHVTVSYDSGGEVSALLTRQAGRLVLGPVRIRGR